MKHSTSTIVKDALFLATHPVREISPAEAILSDFTFRRDNEATFVDFRGCPVQLGMRLTRKSNPSESLIVIFVPASGEWLIADVSNAEYAAQDYIQAVKFRIEMNRAARLEGRR